METSDDELIELLSCHRPVTCMNFPLQLFLMLWNTEWFDDQDFEYLWIVSQHLVSTQASMGPYAWQHKRVKTLRSSALPNRILNPEPSVFQHLPLEGEKHVDACPKVSMQDPIYLQHEDLRNLPRSMDVFSKIQLDPQLHLSLPKPNVTAGHVMAHGIREFQTLLEKNKPMTFKFGFTHDPSVRWHNSKFGYKYSKDKFDFMLIIYAASNPYGPSFLEAALIDRFGCCLFAPNVDSWFQCMFCGA